MDKPGEPIHHALRRSDDTQRSESGAEGNRLGRLNVAVVKRQRSGRELEKELRFTMIEVFSPGYESKLCDDRRDDLVALKGDEIQVGAHVLVF
jgi:hypothetical protein